MKGSYGAGKVFQTQLSPPPHTHTIEYGRDMPELDYFDSLTCICFKASKASTFLKDLDNFSVLFLAVCFRDINLSGCHCQICFSSIIPNNILVIIYGVLLLAVLSNLHSKAFVTDSKCVDKILEHQ